MTSTESDDGLQQDRKRKTPTMSMAIGTAVAAAVTREKHIHAQQRSRIGPAAATPAALELAHARPCRRRVRHPARVRPVQGQERH